MRTTICGFGEASPRRSPKQESDHDQHNNIRFIIELMRPRCLLREKKRKKIIPIQLHQNQQDKQQLLSENKNHHQLTLKDFLLASPCLNNGCTNTSSRVHPSLVRDHKELTSAYESKERFSMDRQVKVGDQLFDRGGMEGSSSFRGSCQDQGGKIKKKVTFKLPQLGDIILL